MSEGFQVDLTALRAAADGIARTMGQLNAHPIASLPTSGSELGHERLAASLAGFCERWHAGVTYLVHDGRGAGEHLGRAAAAYGRLENATREGADGMVRRPGPDPAPR